MAIDTRAPPIIDFSPFYSKDAVARTLLTEQIRDACQKKGFFQIIGHGLSEDLQCQIFEQSEKVFALPAEEKAKLDKNQSQANRGYEALRAQNMEKRGQGDLKEGYYLGEDLPNDHPFVLAKKFNKGPNIWPEALEDPEAFKDVANRYIKAVTTLAQDLLRVIALTLGLQEDWFEEFGQEPITTLRLLHYPPQETDSDALERGIGAHTDFGSVTILLQDNVGGLQVYDGPTLSWIDVVPVPGAMVINLGNLMMRWSNDQYVSNLHRVINKSGRERYSVPFFFNGNPDYLVKCIPGCEDAVKGEIYPPITVGEYLRGRYADSYGSRNDDAMSDPLAHLAVV